MNLFSWVSSSGRPHQLAGVSSNWHNGSLSLILTQKRATINIKDGWYSGWLFKLLSLSMWKYRRLRVIVRGCDQAYLGSTRTPIRLAFWPGSYLGGWAQAMLHQDLGRVLSWLTWAYAIPFLRQLFERLCHGRFHLLSVKLKVEGFTRVDGIILSSGPGNHSSYQWYQVIAKKSMPCSNRLGIGLGTLWNCWPATGRTSPNLESRRRTYIPVRVYWGKGQNASQNIFLVWGFLKLYIDFLMLMRSFIWSLCRGHFKYTSYLLWSPVSLLPFRSPVDRENLFLWRIYGFDWKCRSERKEGVMVMKIKYAFVCRNPSMMIWALVHHL